MQLNNKILGNENHAELLEKFPIFIFMHIKSNNFLAAHCDPAKL